MNFNNTSLIDIIREMIQEVLKGAEEHKRPKEYGAPEGSHRDKQLDMTKTDIESGDPERIERAYRRRERMEKSEREKSNWENKPRSDSKSTKNELTEKLIKTLVSELLLEALSAKIKKTLQKKAKSRGLTPGSVEAEYKKGLAAWATSGSRKGMSAHQWAHARVNSANPSKSWAVVKKSKAKKKK